MRVLLTGAGGFIGRAIHEYFLSKIGVSVLPVLRDDGASRVARLVDGRVLTGRALEQVDWLAVLKGVDVIVHAAGRAHVMREQVARPMDEFRRVNVDVTLNLARQAVQSGVKRFVFLSSIGVNGTHSDHPFTETSLAKPDGDYAVSKYEAERGLDDVAKDTEMEIVVIRPPLVYGLDAPGNFQRLAQAVSKGVPLPFGAIENRRTLVSIGNLVDLVWTCATHPGAGNQLFLAGDAEDVSTSRMIRAMGQAMDKRARLIPVPAGLLSVGASLLGKHDAYVKTCGNLQISIEKARSLLGWQPPMSFDQGMMKALPKMSDKKGL